MIWGHATQFVESFMAVDAGASTLSFSRDGSREETVAVMSLDGMKVRRPKNARKGHPYVLL